MIRTSSSAASLVSASAKIRIRGDSTLPKRVLLPSSLVERDSV